MRSAVKVRESSKHAYPECAAVTGVDFAFNTENNPNPDILLPSLRFTGYTLESAIGDIVDNPLDKEADVIAISIERNEEDWTISVADNGCGMDLITLDQMMRLGSRSDHDLTKDLGKFGLGSTTASLALGRRQHVITSYQPGSFASAATDLDEIVRSRKFVKHLGDARPAEVDLFNHAFSRWGLEVPITGTLVRVTKCDNIQRTQLPPAIEVVKKYVAQTYRHFIWANKNFYVNGDLVAADDPLERGNSETLLLLEDSFEYTYPKGHLKYGETESFSAVLAQLPDWGGIEANKLHGYTADRSGFYVMRNRRQIVAHTTLGFYSRHPEFSRFRGELLFPGTMDLELGVSFAKNAWDIKPSQSLRDKIDQAVRPYMRQARRLYNKSLKNTAEQIPHDEAAKVIKQRSPFLRKPTTRIERRAPREENNGGPVVEKKPARPREAVEPRAQDALADLVSFEVKDLGPTAPIFEAQLIGRKTIVTYNGQHPFYVRFLLENRDNRSMISGMDYLIYSMATAELIAKDDDTFRFIEKMREDMSFNLRQLLST